MDSAWRPPTAEAVFIAGRKYRTVPMVQRELSWWAEGAPGREQDLDKEPREQPAQTMAE